MVASRSMPIGRPSGPYNERCVSIAEALELGKAHMSVWPLGVSKAERNGKLTAEEISSTNVRVGDYIAQMHVTGCIPEHEHMTSETMVAVVDCPMSPAERCASCILNLADGASLQASMKPSAIITGITKD